MIKYNEEEARKTDRAYSTPDVVRQRMRTLEVLKLQTGETVLDVGCGSGLLTQDMATLVGEQGRWRRQRPHPHYSTAIGCGRRTLPKTPVGRE